MTAYEIALKLTQGKTIERKDIEPVKKQVSKILKSFKNNCNLVIKQIKEDI